MPLLDVGKNAQQVLLPTGRVSGITCQIRRQIFPRRDQAANAGKPLAGQRNAMLRPSEAEGGAATKVMRPRWCSSWSTTETEGNKSSHE